MDTRRDDFTSRTLVGFTLSALLLFIGGPVAHADDTKEPDAKIGSQDLSRVPPEVAKAFEARFPGAKIKKWTQETENGVVIYDFEFSKSGKKLEADLRADGTIQNWEEQLKVGEVPEKARAAVETSCPGAVWHEVMRVNTVKEGKDALVGYEILMEMLDSTNVEVMVSPEGKILEDSRKGD